MIKDLFWAFQPPAPGAPPRTPGSLCAKVVTANASIPNEHLIGRFRDPCGSVELLFPRGIYPQTGKYHVGVRIFNEKSFVELA